MSEIITPTISQRICQHMNEDHAEAIVLYAQVFGASPGTERARMLSIDAEGMDLSVEIGGETQGIRINFDHSLQDAEDAHHTLIDMLKVARKGSST